MSIYGKFLVEFTPGDWAFAFVTSTAGLGSTINTINFTTGDATTDLLGFLGTMVARMESEMVDNSTEAPASSALFPAAQEFSDATYSNSTCIIAVGTTQNAALSSVNFQQVWWAGTSQGFLDALGFDGTESVSGDRVVRATNLPRYCWFPGRATYGDTGGAGITSDTGWLPVDAHSRVVSGGGNMRIVGPSRMQYTRRLRFEALKRSEVIDSRHTGPVAFLDQWATKVFRWYPDRDVGTITTTGTQGDPGPSTYHVDDDCDYWRCALAKEPQIRQGSDPDWFTINIELNGEPA